MKNKIKENYKINIYPLNLTIDNIQGESLMDILLHNNIQLPNNCGSRGSCRKCIVKLVNGELSKNAKYNKYYLACKTQVHSDVDIELVKYKLINKNNNINKNIPFKLEQERFELKPIIEKKDLKLSPPCEGDKIPDQERVFSALGEEYYFSLNLLRKLPDKLRDNNWHVDAIIDHNNNELLNITNNTNKIYGLAIDIGTTTINSLLIDMQSGEIIDCASCYNSQISCGTDVISRIVYSKNSNGLEKLNNLLIDDLNNLINSVLKDKKINKKQIYTVSVAANTTMIHLLAKVNPQNMRLAPYVPVFSEFQTKANELELNVNKNANLISFPNVGSYVGGDIVSGIMACGMCKDEKIKLLIDLGTNGEIVLGNSDWLMACACSAGPAFEGAGVKCGTRAIDGAIEGFSIKEGIRTINNSKPIGICGSGMIEVISELFDAGVLDRQGKFRNTNSKNIIEKKNKKAYLLCDKDDLGTGQSIFINEQDIENIIRTKGAIFSGVQSLIDYAGIKFDDIDEVIIAGGLGESINFEKAVKLGLFPSIAKDKFKYLGNLSLKGSYLRLINKDAHEDIEHIKKIMNYFDISEDTEYMNRFVSALFIPHTDLSLFSL